MVGFTKNCLSVGLELFKYFDMHIQGVLQPLKYQKNLEYKIKTKCLEG